MDEKKNKPKDENIHLEEKMNFKEKKHKKSEIDQKQNIENKIFDFEDGQNDNETEQEKTLEENLQEEINQLRDEKLRLLAEMENLRKRSEKERIDSIRYGSMNLARDILSPDDNLTRALDAIPHEEEKTDTVNNLIDGLKMVQKEFSNILEKYGIKKIKALNSKFDHNFHQAMVEIENNDVEEGIVIQEIQSGYTMHTRLLRPSMVGVAKKKVKNSGNEKDDKKKG